MLDLQHLAVSRNFRVAVAALAAPPAATLVTIKVKSSGSLNIFLLLSLLVGVAVAYRKSTLQYQHGLIIQHQHGLIIGLSIKMA